MHKLTHLRAVYRTVLFLFGTFCVVVPSQLLWMAVTGLLNMHARQSPIVRAWYKYVLWIIQAEVTLVNRRCLRKKQKIFLCNHISYVDILCLGAAFDFFFVAKSDVADWPVFGFLSKIGGTIFISRKRQLVKDQIVRLKKHIQRKQSLFIFPEGTTSDGMHVLPFKSSLLNVLNDIPTPPPVQPVTLVYTHLNGKKITEQSTMDKIAWYADMTLAPHLWDLFRQKSLKAKIILHPAITLTEEMNVKELTHQAQDVVHESFHHYMA